MNGHQFAHPGNDVRSPRAEELTISTFFLLWGFSPTACRIQIGFGAAGFRKMQITFQFC